jgi:phosphoribosylformylglycinamidine (FGAM) synthase PurS component
MSWRIEVKDKPGIFDAVGEGISKDIFDLGIKAVKEVRFIQVYIIDGALTHAEVDRICEELLADTVAQEYRINSSFHAPANAAAEHVLEVAYNPGVMDPVEESTLKAIKDLRIQTASSVKTAKKYLIKGKLNERQLKTISEKLLCNKLIQHVVRAESSESPAAARTVGYTFNLVSVDLLSASLSRLKKVSKDGQLFLNITEMRQIKNYFKKLGRNPTDCELETIAQTWSEHCWHKTFRGRIDYRESIAKPRSLITRKIDNLLKATIMKATKELNKPWCV